MNDAVPEGASGESGFGSIESAPDTPAAPGGAFSATPPPWVPRVIIYVMLAVAAFLTAWNMLTVLRNLLVMLLAAGFISFAVEPAVNNLEARGWRRNRATSVAFMVLIVLAVAFTSIMVKLVIDQVVTLAQNAPGYLDNLTEWVNKTFNANISTEFINEQLQRYQDNLSRLAADLGGRALSVSASVIGSVFQMFTVGLFAYYLVSDGPRFRRTICSVLPPKRQRLVLTLWELAIEKTGGYIYSRAILSLASGVSTWIVLTVLGVPSPVPLAIWTGLVSQFVPVVGTYLAGLFPMVVALADKPINALIVLVFVLVYQQIENYVFAPRITARTMEIHPAVAFGSVIAGASMIGSVGALLALPVAAVVQAFVSSYVHRHEVVDSVLTEVGQSDPDADTDSEERLNVLERIQTAVRVRLRAQRG